MKKYLKFLSLLNKGEKLFLFIVFLLSFIVLALETVGVATIPIIFTKFIDDGNIGKFEKIPEFFNTFLNMLDSKISLTIFIICLFFLKSVFNYFHFFLEYFILKRIRIRLLHKWIEEVLEQDYLTIQKTPVSHKIWYMGLVDTAAAIISNFLNLFKGIIICISIFLIMIFFSPINLIIFYFMILISLIIFYGVYAKKIANYGKLIALAKLGKVETLQSIFMGIKNLIIYKKQSFFKNEFSNRNLVREKNLQLSSLIGNIPNYFLEFIGILFICFYFLIVLNQNIPKSELIFNIGLVSYGSLRILSYYKLIANNFSLIKSRKFDLNTFVDETITSQDIKRIQNKKNYSGNCNYNSNLTNGIAIKIQGLNFGYADNALIKIQHYEFKINKFYIIIGESGVGKSTFLDLMLNIIKSDEGQIDYSIDSKKIGYVSQECFLLNDTIRKNIAFGVRENLIDDKKIDDVINKVNLSDFINKFPEKKNYKVTNNGSNISIGQKQRIGIARALYFEPDLIFFDEPTSSLDEFNEKLFLNIIDDIKKTSTVIMVTHKYKNMKNFDHLVELINGNLVEKKPS